MRIQLGKVIKEYSKRNKNNNSFKVFSVTNSSGFIPSTEYFSKEVFSKDLSNYKIVKQGMIAYNPSRINVGSVACQNKAENVIVSPLYIVFSVDASVILPEILELFLKSNIGQKQIKSLTSGSVRDSLKYSALERIEINIPPLNIQKEILGVFSKLSILIDQRKQQLNKINQLAKSRFIEMFGDFPLNEKKWETGQIRNVVYDVRYGTSLPASLDGKYPYFRMNNITYSGELDLSEIKRINIPDREFSKYAIQKGDVLFNRTNSKELVGKTCVYDKDDKMILAGFIIRIRVNDRMLAEFLSAFLNADFSKKMLLEKCKTAIGQANINAQELQNFDIYIPPIELQKQFVFIKNQLDKSKFRMKKCLNLFSYMRHLRIIGI